MHSPVTKTVIAAISYFATIFALGFLLGTVRTLWGAGALGETTFILFEVPILLIASWWSARSLCVRHSINSFASAAVMGACAFSFLVLAELLLAASLSGQSASEWFARLWKVPQLFGRVGQITFGAMPLLVGAKTGE